MQPTVKKELRLRLSMDMSCLIIYWSVTALVFFSAVISVLELQRLNALTVFLTALVFAMVVLSRSAHVYVSDNQVVFSYVFGLKNIFLAVEEIHKAIVTDKRKIDLLNKKSVIMKSFNLSKKNQFRFCAALKQKKTDVVIKERDHCSLYDTDE